MRSIRPKPGMVYVMTNRHRPPGEVARARIERVVGDTVWFTERGSLETTTVGRIVMLVQRHDPDMTWRLEYPYPSVLDLPEGI